MSKFLVSDIFCYHSGVCVCVRERAHAFVCLFCVCVHVCVFILCVCVYFVCVFGGAGGRGEECNQIFLFPLWHLRTNLPKLISKTTLWLLCDQKQLEKLCVGLFMWLTLVLMGLTLMFT